MLTKQPIRPICKRCEVFPARSNGISSLGYTRWHRYCNSCAKKKYTKPRDKDTTCNTCGFVAEHACQLDVVDTRTICANCHRLEIHHKNEQRRTEREITVDATVDCDNIRL